MYPPNIKRIDIGSKKKNYTIQHKSYEIMPNKTL